MLTVNEIICVMVKHSLLTALF